MAAQRHGWLCGIYGLGAWREGVRASDYECAIDIITPVTTTFRRLELPLGGPDAALMGREDEARTYFGMAREHLDQSGQRPLRAVVDFDEAGILAKGDFGARDQAIDLARGAEARFRDLG